MAPAGRTVAVLGVLVLLAVLLPGRPAFACSCAPMTLETVAEREPDAAVARVVRIDDGTRPGTGRVLHPIVGELPQEVPLHLDDGGSCQPWVGLGEIAVLAFEPARGGWQTMQCGKLDPATGLSDLEPETDAADVAAVLSGRFPAAELVALDAELRVIATGNSPVPDGGTLHACGEGVLSHGYDESGQLVVRRLTLPTFEVVDEYLPDFDPQLATADAQDVVCRDDGTVDVLVLMWPEEPDLQLHRDVFGDLTVESLHGTQRAAFVDEMVVLMQPGTHGAGPLRLFSYEPDDGRRELLVEHPLEGDELHVAPDGRHVLVGGLVDDAGPVALVVDPATGRVVAEQRGNWQPVHRPWLGGDRLLLHDWDSGGIGTGERSRFRVVDLELNEVASFEDAGLGVHAPGVEQALVSSSHGIEVFDRDRDLVRTRDALWAGAAADGLLLDEISEDPAAEPLRAAHQVAATDPEPSAAEPSADDPAAPAGGPEADVPWLPVAGVVLAALVAAAAVRLRPGRRTGE